MVDAEAAEQLCRQEFAHYPMLALICNGLPEHRRFIGDILKQDLRRNAQDRAGSYAVKAILSTATPEQHEMANELLAWGKQDIASLKRSTWGQHVFWALKDYLRHQYSSSCPLLRMVDV